MTLKSKLLNPKKSNPIMAEIFGGKFPIQKMSTAEMSRIDQKQDELLKSRNAYDSNLFTASTILKSIVSEDGSPMSESVSPEEILDTYDLGAVNAAAQEIYKINLGGSEGISEAKKD